MHVHDLNPKRTLIAVSAFTLILLIGFFTMQEPLMSYKLDLKQSLESLNDPNGYYTPQELDKVLNQRDQNVVLIDIRDRFSFGQGHIPGAKNITAFELSQDDNIELMKQYNTRGITVVLYGTDQLEVNGSWMLGRQVGFDNIKVLLGGYDYYLKHNTKDTANIEDKSYIKEVARYDYAKLAKSTSDDSYTNTTKKKKPVIIRRRKKTAVASGGC